MSIGEFARQSRLSPRALRLYDELGLLPPARVDTSSGYRYYDGAQLESARLVAALRQLQFPLSEIRELLSLPLKQAAVRIDQYWATVEAQHADRRELARYLVERLSGRSSIMYEVSTRAMPRRSLLCVKRTVVGEAGAWAFGKEFIALLRKHDLPSMAGRTGATFCIYWGEVNDDSDGPIEWCRPVPDGLAASLAGEIPELRLRSEPAHQEAVVHLGPWGDQLSAAQWQLVAESLRAWTDEHGVHPNELGARVTFLAEGPVVEGSRPDCDFAVPIS